MGVFAALVGFWGEGLWARVMIGWEFDLGKD